MSGDDERFFTPRAQANSARSTSSYNTPRTSRSLSSSDGEHYITPRMAMGQENITAHGSDMRRMSLERVQYLLNQRERAATGTNNNLMRPPRPITYSSIPSYHRNTQQQQSLEELFSLARHNRASNLEHLFQTCHGSIDTNIRDNNGNTLLIVGCQNGHKKVVKCALRYGGDIDATNSKGNTALHFCFKYGFGESLGEYLISKGADQRIRNHEGKLYHEV